MSAQYGRVSFDGELVEPIEFDKARTLLSLYGPDADGCFRKENFGVLYRGFQTTKESRYEVQPHVSLFGDVITWDGRLDNREELLEQLAIGHPCVLPDVEIIAAAYERWGTGSFSKFVGDWALSVWNSREQALLLAKDFVGTRHLYYTIELEQVRWCTVLDPLVHFGGHCPKIEEEYVAGWLSSFPATHLTPYVGIRSVPPSSFVRISRGTQITTKYWDFDSSKKLRYRSDYEYEEHFRELFAQSVRCRLRSDRPVLAELSGGIDSASIVCIGDALLGQGSAETSRLDTVSYFDDSEPNWNERPYFLKVEQKRGRTGYHIDVASQEPLASRFASDRLPVTPNSHGPSTTASQQLAECIASGGNCVMLSGVGGDEVTGGVPTPIPELQDLLAGRELHTLVRQLNAWALEKRLPWFHLLVESVRGFLPPALVGPPGQSTPPEWLNPTFRKRNFAALTGYPSRVRFFGPLPSFQENMFVLDSLRRLLSCTAMPSTPCYEKRYPYLDRCFLEFIFSIPREQLVRPGNRRSLMRRALRNLVPSEVLDRRRKGFVIRNLLTTVSADWQNLISLSDQLSICSLGIVNRTAFVDACQQLGRKATVSPVTLARAALIENFLRNLQQRRVLAGSHPQEGARRREPNEVIPFSTLECGPLNGSTRF